MLGAACGLSALARPEGCLVFAVIAAHLALVRSARRMRALLILAAAFTAVYLPYLLWRASYYGYPFPNTFYAKVGFHLRQLLRGSRYGMGFTTVAALLLAPILVALLTPRKLTGRRDLRLLIALFAAYSAYIVAVGGDGLAAYRFFAPLIPVLCLAAAACAGLLLEPGSLVPFLAAAFLYNIVQMNVGYGIQLHRERPRRAGGPRSRPLAPRSRPARLRHRPQRRGRDPLFLAPADDRHAGAERCPHRPSRHAPHG